VSAPPTAPLDGVLPALGYAVLGRVREDVFERLGPAPDWFAATFAHDGSTPFRPGDTSSFLQAFLQEAAQWWRTPDGDRLSSGPFHEEGLDAQPRTLEATALVVAGRPVLLVGPPLISYDTSSAWLGLLRETELAAERARRRTAEREVLLHTIVHDLANPLAGIRGSLRLMTEAPGADAEAAELAAIALRSADRMREMIGSILHTFRDEVAPLLPSTQGERADAAAAVRYVAEAFRARAQVDGISLETRAPEGVLPVLAEQSRLERVLLNLADNAFRHAPAGGTVAVRAERDGDGVRLVVDDDGPGVRPEAVPRLFESFGQRGGQPGQVGLGLYSCRIAAEGWGGAIGYAPRPGGGARFWVQLRLAEP
jgi:signal transduction histidine kinase